MLIQVSINNIDGVEQGEGILRKWRYRLDEDQSHVLLEREAGDALVRVAGFHPWAEELDDGEGDGSCECDGGGCCCEGDSCDCHGDDENDESGMEEEDNDDEEGEEESETIYLGQALFVPAADQARALAQELLEDDYVGTVTISVGGAELTTTDAFRALQPATKDAVIAALEELGDTEAYLSMYEVMGFKE